MLKQFTKIPSFVAEWANLLTVVLVFISAVTWLAAQEAILFWLPIIISLVAISSVIVALVMLRTFWLSRRVRSAELKRDWTIATNEGRLSNLEIEKVELRLRGEGRLWAAGLRQVEQGKIHPVKIGDSANMTSFPIATIKHNEVTLELPLPQLPSQVNLTSLLMDRPSLDNLILGVGAGNEVITDSLSSLTHIAVAGSTRWGKSIFLQMLLYQIVTAAERVELYLADLGGSTFVDFGLEYASTLSEAEALVNQVMAKAEERKQLYQNTGRGIKNLDHYNEVTGQNLPYVLLVIDEALYLMEKSKQIKNSLELAVSWSAKYGITCVFCSQDFKANVIGTSTRNNFSSRFQFLAEDKTQSDVLIKGCNAHEIENKGRTFARLPGKKDIIELQTPYVSEGEIIAIAPKIQALSGWDSTLIIEPEPENDRPGADEMAIIEAVKQVQSECGKVVWSRVTNLLGWVTSGANNQRIKTTLSKWDIDF